MRSGSKTTLSLPAEAVHVSGLPRAELAQMAEAGREILEIRRILGKTGDNVVAEILRNQGTFYEWDHYPSGDVYDWDDASTYIRKPPFFDDIGPDVPPAQDIAGARVLRRVVVGTWPQKGDVGMDRVVAIEVQRILHGQRARGAAPRAEKLCQQPHRSCVQRTGLAGPKPAGR